MFTKKNTILETGLRAMFALVLAMVSGASLQAQTFNVIHYFDGTNDGAYPTSPLTIDSVGNVYGNTFAGGIHNCQGDGCGVVFKMSLHGSAWNFAPLYNFSNGSDGAQPNGPMAIGQPGELYGVGGATGDGMVYELRPSPTRPVTVLPPWKESVLYSFDGSGGVRPMGSLAVDQSGNLYGTTEYGGPTNGTVFELSRNGITWTESTLYSFSGGADGANPQFGVITDRNGSLFGTTSAGGPAGCGTVFELSHSGSGWTETTIYAFTGGSDGCKPSGGLTLDSAGNLYGNTNSGANNGNTYELSPLNGGWSFIVLQSNTGAIGQLAVGSTGTIYGTTGQSVFKLSNQGGAWSYTSLHNFTCGLDGCAPNGASIDAHGNLFGVTESGGISNGNCNDGCGVVWEITP